MDLGKLQGILHDDGDDGDDGNDGDWVQGDDDEEIDVKDWDGDSN